MSSKVACSKQQPQYLLSLCEYLETGVRGQAGFLAREGVFYTDFSMTRPNFLFPGNLKLSFLWREMAGGVLD